MTDTPDTSTAAADGAATELEMMDGTNRWSDLLRALAAERDELRDHAEQLEERIIALLGDSEEAERLGGSAEYRAWLKKQPLVASDLDHRQRAERAEADHERIMAEQLEHQDASSADKMERIRALEEQLAAAQRDVERLDWLTRQSCGELIAMAAGGMEKSFGWDPGMLMSLREAIDAAMQEEETE